ncbi:hypothetical protein CAPTEDRAFT_207904 [Capitella teleta]|uniref:Uncharacterized protein n=1 Tax=Capitella teleta TaxID=283909 RepID=R7VG96_CAPTE|nr:hypothetical protein CAPTEDRAFT_207904 [Capitella teleta]|eukprot:ELU17597.1 hypothetical protein CAPTEDRAFT_207904 [Capitella teleta]
MEQQLAVKENVLKNDDDENNTHSALADFYQQHCKDDAYITQDLPEHLHRAAMKQRLVDFYRKDKRSIPCPVFTRQLHLHILFYPQDVLVMDIRDIYSVHGNISAQRLSKLEELQRSVRCEQFTAHLASSQSYPICVCVFCEHKQRAFSPLPLLARATCPICASFVPDFCRKEERLRAKMCHRHWMQQNLLQKCFICKRIIHNNEKKLDLYLCQICGNRGSKCAMLSV